MKISAELQHAVRKPHPCRRVHRLELSILNHSYRAEPGDTLGVTLLVLHLQLHANLYLGRLTDDYPDFMIWKSGLDEANGSRLTGDGSSNVSRFVAMRKSDILGARSSYFEWRYVDGNPGFSLFKRHKEVYIMLECVRQGPEVGVRLL